MAGEEPGASPRRTTTSTDTRARLAPGQETEEHHPEREEEEGDFATGEGEARDTHEGKFRGGSGGARPSS